MTSEPIIIYPAHSFAHDDDLQKLLDLLEPDWVQGRDYIITAPRTHDRLETGGDTALLLIELIQLMAPVDVVWALAGGYASRSDYIEFENIVAALLGKPTLALPWHGQINPSIVATRDGERPVIRRNKKSIIEATLDALPPWRRSQVGGELLGVKQYRLDPLGGLSHPAGALSAGGGGDPLAGVGLSAVSARPSMHEAGALGAIRRADVARPTRSSVLDLLSPDILGPSHLDAAPTRERLPSLFALDLEVVGWPKTGRWVETALGPRAARGAIRAALDEDE